MILRTESRPLRAVASIALVFLGAALSLIRQRGHGALETLWAEDGSIFLQDAVWDPNPRVWLRDYAGYMHLAPRVLAALAATLPIEWAALVMSGGAALVVSLLALLVFRISEPLIPGALERLILVVAILLSPSAGIEAANSAANIHWYLLYAVGWVVVSRPNKTIDIAASSVMLFAAATSSPFASLGFPILAWHVARKRRPADIVCLTSFGAGVLVQFAVILTAAGTRPLDPLATHAAVLLRWYGFHVLEAAAFGVSLRNVLVDMLGTAGSGALALALLAYLIAPAARAAVAKPSLPSTFVFLHAVFYFLPVTLAQTSTPRYAIAPILLIYSISVWGIGSNSPRKHTHRRLIGLVVIATLALIDFPLRNERSVGPGWRSELRRARARCAEGAIGNATLRIPPRNLPAEDPRSAGGFWSVTLPCGEILRSERGLRGGTTVTSLRDSVTQAR